MTLKEALKRGAEILKEAGIEAPAADAGVMLCHAAACDRVHLYAHGEESIGEAAEKAYLQMLSRRAAGMPVQYITGHCEFMSLDFLVAPGILIPRQDTEILVEYVIDFCKRKEGPVRILDIGTGSGCISVSLAHYLKDCFITAVDISQTALDQAFENALRHKVSGRIELIRSSLLESLSGRKFDIVVSNPPYARKEDIVSLQREVRDYEPREALDGGEDGLDFYRAIAGRAHGYLTASGLLAFEVGAGQAHEVKGLMYGNYTDFAIIKDLSGIERVVAGRLKSPETSQGH